MLLPEFLEQGADLFPEKVALIYGQRRLTFSEIDGAANCLGNALIAGGLKRQERVAIYLDNSVESVISVFGVLKADGIFTVVNPQVKVAKLEYILNDSQTRVLVTDVKHLEAAPAIAHHCSSLKSIILVDYEKAPALAEPGGGTRLLSYSAIMGSYPTSRPVRHSIDIDLAALVYTSGTTGNPKGVMLTHLNMVSAAASITEYLENTSDDVIVDVLPLSFDYGLYQVLMAFKCRATLVLERSFVFPYQVIDSIVKNRVTGFPLVPTIAAMLLTLKNLEKHDFSHLRYLTSTGQVLPPPHIARLRQIFPKSRIFSMYGLTECKRVAYLPPEELDRRPSSVGKAMPNVEVYLVDGRGREITQAHKIGKLVVRGSNVMRGYWNLPKQTALVLRRGRYPGETVLHTGDLFEKDEDGYLYFRGRKDDMFKSSGELVSPVEVENALCSCDDIVEAAVVGVPDPLLGQAIKAYVVLKADSTAGEQEILRFCSERMESFMVPKYLVFVRALPKTPTGKIQKSELK